MIKKILKYNPKDHFIIWIGLSSEQLSKFVFQQFNYKKCMPILRK